MNKVESLIKEELGKTIIDLAVQEIKLWAKKEIDYLRYALDYPVVLQVSHNNFVIGDYKLKSTEPGNNFVYKEQQCIHNFYNKKAAILYIVLERMKYYKLSQELLNNDKKASKFFNELTFYTEKFKKNKNKELSKKELHISRYLESKAQFNLAKSELEKSIRHAKYIKIWDKIL